IRGAAARHPEGGEGAVPGLLKIAETGTGLSVLVEPSRSAGKSKRARQTTLTGRLNRRLGLGCARTTSGSRKDRADPGSRYRRRVRIDAAGLWRESRAFRRAGRRSQRTACPFGIDGAVSQGMIGAQQNQMRGEGVT